MTRFTWGAVTGYVAVILVLAIALYTVRRNALTSLRTEPARAAWEDWRDATRRQDGISTPVDRRVPASAEPPTLVLLRDHFGVVVIGMILITSALYWTFALMARGVISGPGFRVEGIESVEDLGGGRSHG